MWRPSCTSRMRSCASTRTAARRLNPSISAHGAGVPWFRAASHLAKVSMYCPARGPKAMRQEAAAACCGMQRPQRVTTRYTSIGGLGSDPTGRFGATSSEPRMSVQSRETSHARRLWPPYSRHLAGLAGLPKRQRIEFLHPSTTRGLPSASMARSKNSNRSLQQTERALPMLRVGSSARRRRRRGVSPRRR